eukprot:2911941-Prymnesium_polylepis.1
MFGTPWACSTGRPWPPGAATAQLVRALYSSKCVHYVAETSRRNHGGSPADSNKKDTRRHTRHFSTPNTRRDA